MRASESAREAADADGPPVRVDPRDVDARSHPQCLGNAPRSGTANVLAANQGHRRRHVDATLGLPGEGGELRLDELLERKLLQIAAGEHFLGQRRPHRGETSFAEVRGYTDAHTHGMAFEFLGGRNRSDLHWDLVTEPTEVWADRERLL